MKCQRSLHIHIHNIYRHTANVTKSDESYYLYQYSLSVTSTAHVPHVPAPPQLVKTLFPSYSDFAKSLSSSTVRSVCPFNAVTVISAVSSDSRTFIFAEPLRTLFGSIKDSSTGISAGASTMELITESKSKYRTSFPFTERR